MKKYIQVNGRQIIVTSKKGMKSVKMYIRSNTLHISKPTWYSMKDVVKLINEKETSIGKLFEKNAKFEFEDGARVMLLGKIYILNISECSAINKISIEKNDELNVIKIVVPKIMESDSIKKAYKLFLKNQTMCIVSDRLKYYTEVMKSEIKAYSFRDKVNNLGTYNIKNKSIIFSSRLAVLKKEAIDAVIVHELAHEVYHNHGHEFYNYIEQYICNYNCVRKYIKENIEYLTML